jgi:hypothetical protein
MLTIYALVLDCCVGFHDILVDAEAKSINNPPAYLRCILAVNLSIVKNLSTVHGHGHGHGFPHYTRRFLFCSLFFLDCFGRNFHGTS